MGFPSKVCYGMQLGSMMLPDPQPRIACRSRKIRTWISCALDGCLITLALIQENPVHPVSCHIHHQSHILNCKAAWSTWVQSATKDHHIRDKAGRWRQLRCSCRQPCRCRDCNLYYAFMLLKCRKRTFGIASSLTS